MAGRVERFCNLGSWCVLPDYRSRSISLLNALLAQEGYNFTILSPDAGPQEILAWLRFRFLTRLRRSFPTAVAHPAGPNEDKCRPRRYRKDARRD